MKFLTAKLWFVGYHNFNSGLNNVYILLQDFLLILNPEIKFMILKMVVTL